MNLIVRTINLKTGLQIGERFLNYRQHDARVWLQRQIAWACNNQHGLQIINADDEIAEAALAA